MIITSIYTLLFQKPDLVKSNKLGLEQISEGEEAGELLGRGGRAAVLEGLRCYIHVI